MTHGDANREALPTRIGDRYRVERLLGKGGMASVYQVVDDISGRQLALKRLQWQPPAAEVPPPSAAGDPNEIAPSERRPSPPSAVHAAQLFEREFDTLSQLVHPRIIEVYEFHRDAHGPYYTMELLDGGDLRALSPLPWREACRLLCDVCSAMSLLHSRRLAHRDLTPLNIRCTRAGSAKLFDFGSMTPFGRSRHVVGTPPFIAPEALHGEVVDAQTDLFALGATAYYALTGRHAYPARQLLDLPDAWSRPPLPPSHHVADIPPALDELVAWLLALAPSARPPSAAEVIERLSAIGGFDLQEELVVRQAYLSTPSLVGRADALDRVRARLRSAADGDGGTIVVSAAAGCGRTRLLDASARQARLSGALVLRADEREGGVRWGVVRALLRQLLERAPDLALPAAQRRAASLVHLLPEVDPAGGLAALELGGAGEQTFRAQAQTAMRDLIFDVAQARTLIIVVDDVHRIDEPSAAFLALIAHESRRRKLLLIASAPRNDQASAASALQWLLNSGESIRLKNLTVEETELLVRSLFGETPNVRLVADRVYGASQGNPGAIMQIARQLVASGSAHYAAGTWTLPSEIEVAELSLLLDTRVDPRLSPSALELARAIAACDDQRLTWYQCLSLTLHAEPRQLIRDIDELVAAGVLSLDADHYFVNGAGLRAALLRGLSKEELRSLHARLAGFYARNDAAAFRIALHHFLAGQLAEAVDVVMADLRSYRRARAQDPSVLFDFVQSLPHGWEAMMRALIAACPQLGRTCRERLELQLALVAYSLVTSGYERECLREVVVQLRHDCGLDLYAELGDAVPAQERLVRALTAAQERYGKLPESERGMPVQKAISALSLVLVQAIGMAGRTLDYELLMSMPRLDPLLPLSPALSAVQLNVDSTCNMLCGRTVRGLHGNYRLLDQLGQPGHDPGMTDTDLTMMTLAVNWSTAIIESVRGDPCALARAEIIEVNPLFAVNAWRVRAMYALFQGDLQAAERCPEQTEMLQIQNSPPQLFEGLHNWLMALGYFAAHDLLRLKQCITDLEAMARKFESWKPTVMFARGAYQTLRGDGDRALIEFERALSTMELGRHAAWVACAGGVSAALNVQGHFEESARRGYALLDQIRRADLVDYEFFLTLPLAQAEIERGRLPAARQLLATVVEALEGPRRRNVYLGRAYELQTLAAVRAGDAREFRRAFVLCEQQYAPSRNALLRGKLEQLQRAARDAGLLAEPLVIERRPAEPEVDSGSMVATVLSSCEQTQERVDRALLLLTRHTRCKGGFLYTLRNEGPLLVAQRGGREPLPQLDELVQRFVMEQARPREITRSQYVTATGNEAHARWSAPDGAQFVPMLLAHNGELGPCITGVAVMWLKPEASYRVPAKLITAVSRTLHERGDTLTLVDKPHWQAN